MTAYAGFFVSRVYILIKELIRLELLLGTYNVYCDPSKEVTGLNVDKRRLKLFWTDRYLQHMDRTS